MEAAACDEKSTVPAVDRWATPPPPARSADAGPTRRQRAALAVVRGVIGDATEQLEVLRRISVGLPVVVHERQADGSILEHALKPSMADVRAACMFLIERRWGRSRWSEAPAAPSDGVPGASSLALPEGMRLRMRELAREFVLEQAAPAAVEKGHSPRDAEREPMPGTIDLVPVWPAQGERGAGAGGEEVPRPAGARGRGGARGGVPASASVGPLIEGRKVFMPEPLPNSQKTPGVLQGEVRMPAPCSICGHRHEEECEEYMAGFGRSCRCPQYVDPDVVGEEVVVVSPEAKRVADGMALAAREEKAARCGCGHELGEHFATKATTRCTVCGCRSFAEWRGTEESEGALMGHFARVAKRGAGS